MARSIERATSPANDHAPGSLDRQSESASTQQDQPVDGDDTLALALHEKRVDLGLRDICKGLVRQGRERRDGLGQRRDIALRQVAIAADGGEALYLLDHLARLGLVDRG